MRTFFLWVLLCVAVLANDRSLSGVGGTLEATKGEHPDVRMVREQVKLEVGPRLIYATVDFVFENQGPATRVLMGFPESGYGDINPHDFGSKPGFYAFATWVDGVKVPARREIVSLTKDQTYEAHWVKEVSFAAGQQRNVRVTYVAPVGTSVDGQIAEYVFSGGNWAGKVDESKLDIRILPAGFKVVDATEGLQSDGQRLTFRKTDWEAEQTAHVLYAPGRAGILPESMRREVGEADFKGRSARDLTLMRNEIFARYGRPFKDPQLKAYFESQPWYRVFDGYHDSMVSELERQNADKIAAYQNAKGLNW